jgi:hypothetical protein
MINKRHILAIDFVLVVGSMLLIAGLVGYSQPLVIAPLPDTTTTDTSILFAFEKANLILIDDNLEFTSPLEIFVEDNLVINLKPGTYYWKVEGALASEIRELTIESEIDLKLRKSKFNKESYEIVNAGNTKLNVDVYEKGELTGNVILGVDESEEVSGTKFIGREDEN